jgi:hypothetical protein
MDLKDSPKFASGCSVFFFFGILIALVGITLLVILLLSVL